MNWNLARDKRERYFFYTVPAAPKCLTDCSHENRFAEGQA
ncbi:11905_t:CDS:2 [Entrophospora sp. SA101]|nr:11905_t:CDS:2 [Entrophospora sp. SA101]